MQLPPLAVATLVPCTTTLLPLPDDDPFGEDNPQHRTESLNVEHDDEGARDEAVQRSQLIPMFREEVAARQVDVELAKKLGSGDGTDGPVRGGEGGDEEVDEDQEGVRVNKVLGFAFVESATERSGSIRGLRVGCAAVETDGLTVV